MKKGTKVNLKAWWLAGEVISAVVLNALEKSNFLLVKPDVGPNKMVNKSDVLEVINE